jgi:hypothetical protein
MHTITRDGQWIGWNAAAVFAWHLELGRPRPVLPRRPRRYPLGEYLRCVAPPN